MQVLGLTRIIANIQAQTQVTPQAAIIRLLAFSFIGIWLAAAAILPLIGGIFGLIAGFVDAGKPNLTGKAGCRDSPWNKELTGDVSQAFPLRKQFVDPCFRLIVL